MIIDAFEFARKAREASGSIAVADLTRIDVIDRSGAIEWRVAGSCNADGKPFLELEAHGQLRLACQRCLGALEHEVAVESRLLLARDEAEAESVPLEEQSFDAVLGSEQFDLSQLIEDEIILSLPLVPKHERCAAVAGSTTDLSEARGADVRPSPFAVLAGHRRGKLGS